MTYEPGRDPNNPLDVHPKERPYEAAAARTSTTSWPLILGLLALAVIGAMFFYNMSDRSTVATDTRPAATSTATTGSGTNKSAPRETTGAPMQRPTTPAPAPK